MARFIIIVIMKATNKNDLLLCLLKWADYGLKYSIILVIMNNRMIIKYQQKAMKN